MEICKAPTLRLKALNKHTHIMYIEMETFIQNKKKYIYWQVFMHKDAHTHTKGTKLRLNLWLWVSSCSRTHVICQKIHTHTNKITLMRWFFYKFTLSLFFFLFLANSKHTFMLIRIGLTSLYLMYLSSYHSFWCHPPPPPPHLLYFHVDFILIEYCTTSTTVCHLAIKVMLTASTAVLTLPFICLVWISVYLVR